MSSKYIVANWKMNFLSSEAINFINEVKFIDFPNKVIICPSFLSLETCYKQLTDSAIELGAQDCSDINGFGARTGEINAAMLKDIGCGYVIIGHSERRIYHNEANELIAAKLKTVSDNNLIPILCVGEGADESFEEIISEQLRVLESFTGQLILVAYEPVWAIGTGKVATTNIISKVSEYILAYCQQKFALNVKMLYGGSITNENAQEILYLPNIDGVLVGSSSLKLKQFIEICSIKG